MNEMGTTKVSEIEIARMANKLSEWIEEYDITLEFSKETNPSILLRQIQIFCKEKIKGCVDNGDTLIKFNEIFTPFCEYSNTEYSGEDFFHSDNELRDSLCDRLENTYDFVQARDLIEKIWMLENWRVLEGFNQYWRDAGLLE